MRVHLVICMGLQNCYFSEQGPLHTTDGMFTQQLLGNISSYLCSLRGNTRVCLPFLVRRADDNYYQHEPSYCMVGTHDTAIVSQFAANRAWDYIQVSRPNLVSSQDFRTYLSKNDIDHVTILGTETHQGILLSAASLRDLNYMVTVQGSLVASRDQYLHDTAMSLMSLTAGVDVL